MKRGGKGEEGEEGWRADPRHRCGVCGTHLGEAGRVRTASGAEQAIVQAQVTQARRERQRIAEQRRAACPQRITAGIERYQARVGRRRAALDER